MMYGVCVCVCVLVGEGVLACVVVCTGVFYASLAQLVSLLERHGALPICTLYFGRV